MIDRRFVLGVLVLVSNAAIVVGAVAFEWNSLTVVALFVADGLLGAGRISLERVFARRPPADEYSQLTGPYQFVLWDETLIGKRGSIRITDRFPPVSVRHLPYAIMLWAGLGAVGALITIWYGFAATAPVAPSLVTVLPLFAAKHASIIAVWANANVYERSAPDTVRRFSVFYSVLLVIIAVFLIAPQRPGLVAPAAVLALAPKLLFDFREAGIGPRPLTFDPTGDTSSEELSAPTGTPRYAFRTDDRALLERGYIHIGIPYTFGFGPIVFIITAVVNMAFLNIHTETDPFAFFVILLLALVVIAGLMLKASHRIVRLGHGNVEYRVYDDELEAYDRYLGESQWVVRFDDIESISTEQRTVWSARILPLARPELTTVELECATNEDRRIEFLARPDDFARIVRGKVRNKTAST